MRKHYDAIIIGAGQAGVPLAKKLAEAGKKTALIEKRWVGGTCINDGCTPTKAMVASARAAHLARNASALGVDTGKVKVDFKKIIRRKNKIVKQFRSSSQKGLEDTKGLDLIFATAEFSGERELTLRDKSGKLSKVTADWIFINTGANPVIPDIPGLAKSDYLTSTSIQNLDALPEHLVILGGNYIGLEFGQMFGRFGSKVTILEKSSRIMSREDEDVAVTLQDILEEEGVKIHTGVTLKKVEKDKKGKLVLHLSSKKGSQKLRCSDLLIATGRTPNTASLGLDIAGIQIDEKGHVLVNDKLETNVPGIYALGDVKGGPSFTHIAYHDYTIVYRNLVEGQKLSTAARPVPYCMFTDPQLGRIGLSEDEAKTKGLNYTAVVMPMSHVARGIETGETAGLMKAVVDKDTNKILGAAILAAEGGEVMSVIEMAMEGGLRADQIRYGVFAHPTYSESLNNLFMKIED